MEESLMIRKYLSLLILFTILVIPIYALGQTEGEQTGAGQTAANSLQSPVATPTPTTQPPKPTVGYTPVSAEALSPVVIQRSPRRGESQSPEGPVELIFDQPMDREAVAAAFTLQQAGDTPIPVAGRVSWVNERTMQFTPADPLPRQTTYDVILTQAAASASGEPLREPYTFRFMTAGFLEVAQVIPAGGTTDVETETTITVIFNRPVVPLTTLAEMENLPDPVTFEPEIKGSGEWLNTSIYVFTPAEPLSGGVTYTAQVKASLEDVAGAVLGNDFTWGFTTIPPKVVWVRPRDSAIQVPIDTSISVQFNQPVDPDSAMEAFHLERRGLFRTAIQGESSVIANTLTFTPTNPLDFDQTYLLTVDAGVTSEAGGAGMVEAYEARFTTVPLPRIVSTNPRNGEQNAWPYTAFQITFNAPIDPNTVMPNLSMTPPISPTQVYTHFNTYDNTFVLNFGAQPSTDYTVVIKDGIADPYGNTIPAGRTVKFRTAPLPPNFHLRIPEPVGTYDATQPARIFVGHINLSRLDFRLYQLEPAELAKPYWSWYDQPPRPDQLLREWRVNLEAPLNKQTFTAIDLASSPEGKLEPGLYLLETQAPELLRDREPRRHVLVVTNLNLTLKTGPQEALVWATDLGTGQPLPDLSLTVYVQERGPIETLTTGQDGVARLDLGQNEHPIIVASEDPFSAVGENWGRGISPWDFGLGSGEYSQDYRAYIYTDRPIYRPGQTVHFKGVIRAEDDATFRLADLGRVQVMVRDAAWNEIFNDQLRVGELGTFNGSVELPEGAALGNYSISLNVDDHYFEQPFQVAAYRPPEFEVVVTPDVDEIQRGDDVQATIEAKYLFGGPLAEATLEWNVLAESFRFKPPWGGRYTFSDTGDPYVCFDCWWWHQEPPRQPILSGSGQTDASGTFTLSLDGEELAEAMARGSQRLIIEATVTGPDNQVLSGRESLLVHPGPYYIGLSPQEYVGDAGEESNIDLVAVDWAGERLPEVAVKVEFYLREWINTFIANESGGGHWEWETKETLVDEVTVTSDELGEAVATFIPPKGGSYHIVATPAEPTPATQDIRSSIFIWVAGEDQVSWRRENHDRITLISDKTSYAVGETAEILIPSPFEGPQVALMTIERGHILKHEVVELQNNSYIYRLPITEADVPNIYLSAVLVKGRTADGLADFKMGLLPLDVDLASKTLSLQIEADTEQAEPGEEVTYTVTATDPEGQPASGAELSLDLVDKAVLNLQPRGVDILHSFYTRRALLINTASGLSISANRLQEELAEDLAVAEEGMMEKAGEFALEAPAAADTAAPAEPSATPMPALQSRALNVAPPAGVEIRQEFADTAFWEPALLTDEAGQASVTLTLPDNLTTWVMRGVGLTGDTLLGSETSDLVATKPLLIRPVTPRFFVVDDRAQLAANVTNNTDEDLSVEVALSAEGVGISLGTPPQQPVDIPARSEAKVTWNVTVDDVTEAQLIFSAVSEPASSSGETYADASKPRLSTGPEGSLLVFRYTAPDIVGTGGQLTEGGSRTEAIVLPPTFDERRGQLTVQLDPSLAAGMQAGLRYLEHFKYECTEQTVSRFLPNVLTFNALKSLGIENEELAARLPDLVDTGLEKLYLQQNPDGGWGWWYDTVNYRSNPYVSAYVVFALLKAQEAGIDVSNDVLARGLNYLQTQIRAPRDYKNFRDANQQAWLLYVLAEGEVAPQANLDELYKNREKLSHYARAYLAQALWLDDQNDPRLATLLSDLNNAAILSATGAHWEEQAYDWWAMNTDTRSTAIILDTLAKLDPGNALIPNVVRWLMVARRGGIWETTQETAWSLIALTDWMLETGELEADYDFSATLNDEEIAAGTANRETVQESTRVEVPIAELIAEAANTLTIARSDGNGRLYYTAHLEVHLPVEEIEPAERGIIVSRRYSLADCTNGPACPEVREAKLGDVIRVDLTIIAPNDLYYVVVEDPLPAGGEAIDTGLATTSLLAMDPNLTRQDSRYWWWWHWYSRSELRDEKVVLFADYLPKGTYEYSYTFRTTLPGDYHVIPTVAQEMYFPEVFGRSDGRLLSIGE
jgi:uncharacterized protein YfaS (alpha-2-macroglobulin family)